MRVMTPRSAVRHSCRDEARTYFSEQAELADRWRHDDWGDDGYMLLESRHPTQYAPISSRMKEHLDPHFAAHATDRRKALNRREHERRSMDRAKWPWGLLGKRIDQRWLRNRRRRTINDHIAYA